MAAGELDMEKTDFSMTNATTFDHHTAKITAFFIQASCCCRRCFSCSGSFLSFPVRPLGYVSYDPRQILVLRGVEHNSQLH